jgi:hypothetical protein
MHKSLLFSVLIVLGSNSFAMSNDDYLQLTLDSASARSKEGATFYVNGVTMGFMIANIGGKDTSICFPKQMAINEFNFKSLVNAEMEIDFLANRHGVECKDGKCLSIEIVSTSLLYIFVEFAINNVTNNFVVSTNSY